MIFRKLDPSKQLRHIIRYFWWIELPCENGTEQFSERILPDGSSEMVFHLGDRVSRTAADNRTQPEPTCFLAGQNTSHYDISARGFLRMIGVKFYAHTASYLLRENAARFNDTVVDLAAIWGDSVNGIHERIADATKLGDRISVLENFFCERFRHEPTAQFEYLSWAVQHIVESHGCVGLPQIAQILGVTPRYLEKLFIAHVGISPKLFAQINQLQNGVRLLNKYKTRSLTEICYQSGYYDQSHFIHAVKRFTGLNPSQLKREEMVTQQPFMDALAN
jgi:AraC-like DNA-binding protein